MGCDTDQVGYGNMCDGDFNEDAAVDGIDFGIFKGLFADGKNGVSELGRANPALAGSCPNSR